MNTTRRGCMVLFSLGRRASPDPLWDHHGGPGEPEIAGRIGNAQNLIRDRTTLNVITRVLNEHRRVLVVYGGSHLSSLWRALQDELGPPRLTGRPPLS